MQASPKKVDVNGNSLLVIDQGKGPVLLLVHGFPVDHFMWRHQIEVLSAHCRVLAPDMRGFGLSRGVSETTTMADFAADLASLLDQLGIDEPITLCGLSMGGYIAFQFVERYGDRLQGLILCDTRSNADSEDARQNRHVVAERVLEEGPDFLAESMPEKMFAAKVAPELVAETQQVIRRMDPAAIAAASRGMALRPDAASTFSRITFPTLILVGEEDSITPVSEMETMSRNIAKDSGNQRIHFEVIPQAGHMAPLENPTVVTSAMQNFLQKYHLQNPM